MLAVDFLNTILYSNNRWFKGCQPWKASCIISRHPVVTIVTTTLLLNITTKKQSSSKKQERGIGLSTHIVAYYLSCTHEKHLTHKFNRGHWSLKIQMAKSYGCLRMQGCHSNFEKKKLKCYKVFQKSYNF